MTRRGARGLLLALLVLGTLTPAALAADPPGRVGPALGLTGNGRALTPVGDQVGVGNFPTGGKLTPDGRFYWVVDAGHGDNDVQVIDVAGKRVIQTLPLPGAYVGIVFAPDGRTAYVSGLAKGNATSKTQGPTKGDGGDVVHVFSVDPASGRGAEQDPIALPGAASGGSAQVNSLPPTSPAFPEGLALSPDGSTLVAVLSQADRVALIDTRRRAVRGNVKVGAYPYGAAVSRDGTRAYVTNEYDGTLSVVDVASASVVRTVTGLGGAGGDRNGHPEAIIADPLRELFYVAVANRDLIAVIDGKTDSVSRLVGLGRREGVGTAPVALAEAPDGGTLFSADAGEDALAAISLPRTATAGSLRPRTIISSRTTRAITDYRRLKRRYAGAQRRRLAQTRSRRARRSVLARYRRLFRKLRATRLYGRSARACGGPTRAQDHRYAKAALRAIEARFRGLTRSRRSRSKRRVVNRRYSRALRRAFALLPPRQPCVAPLPGTDPSMPPFTFIGRLPTAAYPTDVQVSPDGSRLVYVSGKGLGTGPNANFVFAGAKQVFGKADTPYGTYVLDAIMGRVGILPRPSDAAIRAATPGADKQVRPTNAQAPPPGSPVVSPGGGPSGKIKHVFYVVRENRTYDQILGRDPRGDGDPDLELFGDNVPDYQPTRGGTTGITPNAHALSRRFPLLDHLYADSEVSIDGHVITAGAYASDYVQKATAQNYGGRGRAFDFGVYPITFPPSGFLFDQAARQSVGFFNYGEQAAGTSPMGDDGRPTYGQVVANTDQTNYPGNLFIGCLPGSTSLGPPDSVPGSSVPATPVPNPIASCTQDSGPLTAPNPAPIGNKSRIDAFRPRFQAQDATNSVPAFNYLILPNDHTNGTTPGAYTPQAEVADNDLALGQLVDLVSHSKIWSSSAIFVIEDDSQDGADHVDAHRMPAFVISPWAKQGAAAQGTATPSGGASPVVSTRYDQYSVLHTVELILGLRPLSLNDGLATPMYDAFDNGPAPSGDAPFSAITPQQSLSETNQGTAAMAALSRSLPFGRMDQVPQAVSDRILWASAHGARSRPPQPGPNASPEEHARAVGALRVYRRGGDAKAWLARRADGGGEGQKGKD